MKPAACVQSLLLLCLLPAHGAAPEIRTNNGKSCVYIITYQCGCSTVFILVGCSDGDVRLLHISLHVLPFDDGDAQGVIMVCDDKLWNLIVVCKGEWTSANTLVTCRQLGYAAAGWYHILAYQISLLTSTNVASLQQILQLIYVKQEIRDCPTHLSVLERRAGLWTVHIDH